jgi:hypothetical protein
MEASRALIPAASVVRPWSRPLGNPQPTTPAPVQTTTQNFALQNLLHQMQAAMGKPGGPQIPQGPLPGYQQMMPVNFHVPQYLTVREDRRPGESIFTMLGREVLRSIGKSIGHTLGNFFDTVKMD